MSVCWSSSWYSSCINSAVYCGSIVCATGVCEHEKVGHCFITTHQLAVMQREKLFQVLFFCGNYSVRNQHQRKQSADEDPVYDVVV